MGEKYNILSLDGGGLRGLITAVLIGRLEVVKPGFLDSIDLVAGTSTGGILALALAMGLSPNEIVQMYLGSGAEIFRRPFSRRVGSLFGLTEAKYDNAGLARALGGVFGSARLRDLKKKVAVTAFDLDDRAETGRTWRPKVFHNYAGYDSDGDELVVSVAMRTSAAPTYFPSVDGYVDGGVFANNPSVAALVQVLDPRSKIFPKIALEDVRLLSVGTGENLRYIEGQRLDWGFARWAPPLVDILMDGVSEVADFQCRQLLREGYHRLQVDFPSGVRIPMDGVADMGRMLDLAKTASVSLAYRWLTASGWVYPRLTECDCWEGVNDREGMRPCEHERLPAGGGPFENSRSPGPCRCGADGPPWHHAETCEYD